MPDLEPPESEPAGKPAFPRPRAREAPSPYREKILPAFNAPPAGRPRLVVTRPDPPGAPRSLELPDVPVPVGPFDGPLRVLRAPLVFLGNHPNLCILLLIAALAMALSACWLAPFGNRMSFA